MSSDFKKMSREELLEHLYIQGNYSSNAIVQYHQAAAERFGLNATDMKTLPLLQGTKPLSAGDLARSLGLTTGAVTSVIDRLERVGLVRRVADPSDRRRVVVELVPEEFAKAAKVYKPLAQSMQRLHERYNQRELAIIAEYMSEVTAIMRRQASNLRQQI